jgi:uncharacterized membrane protein
MVKQEQMEAVCTHSTSVVKAFTWRFIATTITTLLVLWRSGHVALALEVGILDVITKLIAYYLHERGWIKYASRLEILAVLYCKGRDRILKLFGR